MQKYISITPLGYVLVEAENEDQAQKKALFEFSITDLLTKKESQLKDALKGFELTPTRYLGLYRVEN